MFTVSRYLALAFALILAVVEALLNFSRPDGWQYAPLWIIDYVIVVALLLGFWLTRRPGHAAVLLSGWALAVGVFYMALFMALDPEVNQGQRPPAFLLSLIALGLGVQVLGFVLAAVGASRRKVSAPG